MKKITLVFITIISFLQQCMPRMPPGQSFLLFTQQYLQVSRQQAGRNTRIPGYVYKQINNKPYISAFIKAGSDIDEGRLSALGVFTGTKAGNIWTVQIPLENIYAFTSIPGITYIALDQPVLPLLDSARKQTRADSAQKGINLPATVTGRNVITGVIDAGFDLNHPTMYDTTHSQYRIKRIWTQKISGTPPSGFSYGNEMTDTNAMRTLGYDTAILSHGTTCYRALQQGSGYGSNTANSRFRGMAFQSDIVLVGIMPAPAEWEVAGETDVVDGINYIFTYAAAAGACSCEPKLGQHPGAA